MGKIPQVHIRVAILLFLTAILVYLTAGLDNVLLRDNAIFYYSGQQLLQGVPPYASIFYIKTPLTTFVTALGAAPAAFLPASELASVRVLFLLIGGVSVALLFLLSIELFEDTRGAVFSALAMLTLYGLTFQTVAGPRPKIIFLLCEIAALLLLARRSWLPAGIALSLAALTWQPAAILLVAALPFVAMQRERASRPAIGHLLVGFALPFVPLVVYFAVSGALQEFLDGALLFHIRDRMADSYRFGHLAHLQYILRTAESGFTVMTVPVFLGTLYFLNSSIHPDPEGGQATLNRKCTPGVLAVLLFLFWTLFDFQDYPDLFPFVPFAMLGFGKLIADALETATRSFAAGRFVRVAGGAMALFFVGVAAYVSWQVRPDATVRHQRQTALHIIERFAPYGPIVSIGTPEFLALTGTRSPTPFIVHYYGVDHFIERTVPGGFDRWFRQIEATAPSVFVVGDTKGRGADLLQIIQDSYARTSYGPWTLLVRDDLTGVFGLLRGADSAGIPPPTSSTQTQ